MKHPTLLLQEKLGFPAMQREGRRKHAKFLLLLIRDWAKEVQLNMILKGRELLLRVKCVVRRSKKKLAEAQEALKQNILSGVLCVCGLRGRVPGTTSLCSLYKQNNQHFNQSRMKDILIFYLRSEIQNIFWFCEAECFLRPDSHTSGHV